MESTVAGAPRIFDRALLARRLRRAAPGPPPDFLLQRVADDFSDRLGVVRRTFATAASVGCDGGVLARRLGSLPSIEAITDRCASDASEALGLDHESLDLAVSGLSLQLFNDLPGALIQINRALKPDGLMLAALLGGETLTELRQAWLLAETERLGGASPRVAPFADVRELGGLLQRAGFALPVADSDTVRVTYASALSLMQDIKAMGASNMLVERRRVPVTRGLFLRAAEIYQQRFADSDGRIPATFEIITLTGWKPHESQQKPLRPGSAQMRLEDALRPSAKDPEARE